MEMIATTRSAPPEVVMAQFDEILDEELGRYGRKKPTRELSVEALRLPLSSIEAAKTETLPLGASAEAVIRLIERPATSCVVIVDADNRVVGLITERDLCTRLLGKGLDPHNTRVEDIMSKDPITLRTDEPITHALAQMDVGGYRHVPLVDRDNRPAGVVTARRIIHYLVEFFPDEVKGLPPRPTNPSRRHGG
jgi:CBS domain-containing protein